VYQQQSEFEFKQFLEPYLSDYGLKCTNCGSDNLEHCDIGINGHRLFDGYKLHQEAQKNAGHIYMLNIEHIFLAKKRPDFTDKVPAHITVSIDEYGGANLPLGFLTASFTLLKRTLNTAPVERGVDGKVGSLSFCFTCPQDSSGKYLQTEIQRFECIGFSRAEIAKHVNVLIKKYQLYPLLFDENALG
jgi:hypothetical protein